MAARLPRLPFSIDPLIAEAKRRARQRRLLVVLVAVAVVAAAAVLTVELRGLGPPAPVPANLTVLVVGEGFPGYGAQVPGTTGGRALFHLKCDPASGDVADPAKACAAIAAQPSLVTNPKPYPTSGPFHGPFLTGCPRNPRKFCPAKGPYYFRITGSVNGKPVHFGGGGVFATDIALVEKLGLAGRWGNPLHLEPRRHGFVAVNHTRRFAPGVLRPGDLVTCRVHGSYKYPLAMSVPVYPGLPPEESSATPGLMAIRIRADGTVLASCFARDRMPLDKRGRTIYPLNWPPKSLREPALYSPRQVKAAFAAHGIRVHRERLPRWSKHDVALVAQRTAFVEMWPGPAASVISPPSQWIPAHHRFTREANLAVWWNRADRKQVKAALAALRR